MLYPFRWLNRLMLLSLVLSLSITRCHTPLLLLLLSLKLHLFLCHIHFTRLSAHRFHLCGEREKRERGKRKRNKNPQFTRNGWVEWVSWLDSCSHSFIWPPLIFLPLLEPALSHYSLSLPSRSFKCSTSPSPFNSSTPPICVYAVMDE